MISHLLRTSLRKSLLLPIRLFTSNSHSENSSLESSEAAWRSQLENLRKIAPAELTAKTMIKHLSKISQVPALELPLDVKKMMDEYFEDNFKKITAAEAVELVKHCSKIKGTEHCFWIWYNVERIVRPEIFNLSKQQVNDLATAFANKSEGSEIFWYDVYRAFCKIHTDLSFVFKAGIPCNYDEAYIGEEHTGEHTHH